MSYMVSLIVPDPVRSGLFIGQSTESAGSSVKTIGLIRRGQHSRTVSRLAVNPHDDAALILCDFATLKQPLRLKP
jgi:hypothetical protein